MNEIRTIEEAASAPSVAWYSLRQLVPYILGFRHPGSAHRWPSWAALRIR